jgi:amino acid permease
MGAVDKEIDPADSGNQGNVDVESPKGESQEFNLAGKHEQLERGLKSRHIEFLALGEHCPIPFPSPALSSVEASLGQTDD